MKKCLSELRILIVHHFAMIGIVLALCLPDIAMGQGDGPRFYWKGLNGTNAIPVIGSSLGGNANPVDPSHNVVPGADFEASMTMAGYGAVRHQCGRAKSHYEYS